MDWGNWRIVLDPLSGSSERYAADELQAYLLRITGCLVKVVEVVEPFEPHLRQPLASCIFVGPSRLLAAQHPELIAVRLADEEILIRRRGDSLILTGGGKRGVLYAVYVFLERYLGCRFFTEDDEYVPAVPPSLPEAFEFRSAPAFATRDMLSLYLRPGRWAARLRMNGQFANVTALHGFKRAIFPFVYTFAQLVPPARWFKTHPEYFALIRGERNPQQLCLSHPRVLELVTACMLHWIEENPDYDFFSLSENDGGGFCGCAECWKMNGRESREAYGYPSQSGTLFRFVNRVADEIRKRHPAKWIETLSYSSCYLVPPRYFAMAPNVRVRVCLNVDGPNRVRQWLKAASRVGVWHYFIYDHFLLPFPLIMESIPTVLRTYLRLGVRDIFLQTPEDEHGGVESLKLQVYVASKLFWDAGEDPAPHVDAFIRHYYGPAAKAMLRIFDLTQSVLKKRGAHWDCWTWVKDTLPMLRRAMPELDQRAQPLLEQSARSARGTKYALRVAEAALPFRYFDIVREDRQPRYTARHAYALDERPIRRSVHELMRTLRKLNVVHWHHGYKLATLKRAFEPQPLQRLTNRFLDVLILPGAGGRIVQLIDRVQGRELIPSGIRTDGFDFLHSGYAEFAGRWGNEPGYREPYQVVGAGCLNGVPWIRLQADLSHGFRLDRRLELQDRELRLCSRLTNRLPECRPGELRLRGRWRCDPARDRVRVGRESGAEVEGCLDEFKNREVPGGPDTRVVYYLTSLGVRIEHWLPGNRTDKIRLLSRPPDRKENGGFGPLVMFDVFTVPRRLARGESLSLEQVFRIEPIGPLISRRGRVKSDG